MFFVHFLKIKIQKRSTERDNRSNSSVFSFCVNTVKRINVQTLQIRIEGAIETQSLTFWKTQSTIITAYLMWLCVLLERADGAQVTLLDTQLHGNFISTSNLLIPELRLKLRAIAWRFRRLADTLVFLIQCRDEISAWKLQIF